MSDHVEIRGLRVLGHHGALPGERDRAQPFEIDLVLTYDMDAAAKSDDLADAVDYGKVATRASAVVAEGSFALLEALASAVCDAVLEDERVEEVTIRLTKIRPPVALDLDKAGVLLSRRRES